MKLKQWIDTQPITVGEFAQECKIPYSTLCAYLKGVKPNVKRALIISEKTKGAVTLQDLRAGYGKERKKRNDDAERDG